LEEDDELEDGVKIFAVIGVIAVLYFIGGIYIAIGFLILSGIKWILSRALSWGKSPRLQD
jgi:hypothetical protein